MGFESLFSQTELNQTESNLNNGQSDAKNFDDLRTRTLFDSIRSASYKNRWMNELQNIVIRPPKSEIKDTIATLRGELEFLKYKGLIIRSIRFIKLDVFGTSITRAP
jgi:hypothetical protein